MTARVLVVDDVPANVKLLEARLSAEYFDVLTAANGTEGLEVARSEAVDAVVCDLHMPGMDGPAFHEKLRRERPGLAARTVFITGDVISNSARAPQVRQPVLTKPFALEKLEETLVALMRGGVASVTSAGRP